MITSVNFLKVQSTINSYLADTRGSKWKKSELADEIADLERLVNGENTQETVKLWTSAKKTVGQAKVRCRELLHEAVYKCKNLAIGELFVRKRMQPPATEAEGWSFRYTVKKLTCVSFARRSIERSICAGSLCPMRCISCS